MKGNTGRINSIRRIWFRVQVLMWKKWVFWFLFPISIHSFCVTCVNTSFQPRFEALFFEVCVLVPWKAEEPQMTKSPCPGSPYIDSALCKEALHRAPQPSPLDNHTDRHGVFSSVPLELNLDALKDARDQEKQTCLLLCR